MDKALPASVRTMPLDHTQILRCSINHFQKQHRKQPHIVLIDARRTLKTTNCIDPSDA
jgi:hypothetical protein